MIGIGDVVVCVDDSPCKCCGAPTQVVRGRTYQVTDIRVGINPARSLPIVSLYLVGVRARGKHAGWGINSERFRKVQKADDKFTRQIRALRPAKQKEDA
jgi:hypothetical protein